ncbi:hypothetical protein Moror_15659 [Moniliophthora roreri MCA 2997]|uniref:Uncharacterized protein n=1 Tax=Moniliophthora roreri (strain MCA 2997) TaxID=1381753 RepID=V2WLV5_MONRO|nr:hypothetical protein Moror_15659 [Moniliophthora roreri MCA 2997]
MPLQNPRKHSISSPGKDAETIATAPKKVGCSTKPKPASTNPWPKVSWAVSSKTSPDEPIVIKVEKGATPSVLKSNIKHSQSSKVAASHIIVSPPVLDKEDPLVASTYLKGKSKVTPLATDEEDELNALNRSEDVYDNIKIPAPGVQGCKLTKKTNFADHILKYFGSAQVLLNALNSVAQVADSSRSLSPLSTFLHSTTMLPPISLSFYLISSIFFYFVFFQPCNKTLTPPCTRCKESDHPCLFDHNLSSSMKCDGCHKSGSPCSHNRLWFEWVNDSAKELDVAFGSCSGLIYQALSICCDIALYTSLLKTQARLDEQLVALSHSINISQDAFKKCVIDSCQILQFLLFLDPSFSASDAQVASLCASFSWRSSDLLLQDPHDRGYELHEVSHFSDSLFRIFVKGTNINITGKRESEWEINDEDLVVPMTPPNTATTAEASWPTIDASDVDIVAEKSTAVSSSTPSFLSLRDSFIPMSFGPVSSLLRDDSD